MKRLVLCFCAVMMIVGVSTAARATLVNFDDGLSSQSPGDVGFGLSYYGGLYWSNFYYLTGSMYGGTGYANGVVSSPNVAYNGYGQQASVNSNGQPFTFNSTYFTAAFNNGLSITATGYLGSNQTYTQTFTVDTTAPTLVEFNWTNVDTVYFSSSGGTNIGFSPGGPEFAMDNLTYNAPVPLPSGLLLLTPGLAGLAAVRRRLKR